MPFTPAQLEELKVLSQYNQPTSMTGIKIHHTASTETIAAAKRLHEKGLIDQEDGGYLTTLGCEAVEKLQGLLSLLA
ncbi:MAG: TIGR02647 family protein [Methylococcales bacterium]|nr:TIGR02647 family protein [Methylococcales bacterium]